MAAVAGLVLALAWMSACGSSTQSNGSSGLGKDVTIGVDEPISGSAAAFGGGTADGARYAAYVANQQKLLGDTEVKLDVRDDQNTNQQAIVNVTALASGPSVAIFGPIVSNTAKAVTAVTAQKKILSVLSQADGVTLDGTNTNVYNLTPPGASAFQAIAKYLSSQGVKTLAFICDPVAANQPPLMDAATKILADQGITVTERVPVDTKQTLFTATTSKLAASGVDAIDSLTTQVTAIQLRELRDAGYRGKVVTYNGPSTLFAPAGSAAEGLIQAVYFTPLSTDPAIKTFVDGYTKWSNGKAPTSYTAEGYDAVMSIVAAVKAANSTDRAAVLTAYQNLAKQGFSGLQGKYTFDVTNAQNRRPTLAGVLIVYGPDGQPAQAIQP